MALPITKHNIGTMAGGAADCSFWIRKLRSCAKSYELENNSSSSSFISVSIVSRTLANYLCKCRCFQLSVGTMVIGYDATTTNNNNKDDNES